MSKAATAVTLTDLAPKWGLVTVFASGAIDRQYRIDGAAMADVLAGGKPSGCTDDEWKSGLVNVSGRPCFEGMGAVNPDGSLAVNYGITEADARVSVDLMLIPSAEWEARDGVVWIEARVATVMGL